MAGTPSLPPVPPPSSVLTTSSIANISDAGPASTPAISERQYYQVIPWLISRAYAERLLLRFTTAMIHHFPFVVLPADVSLDVLQQERPILLLSILAAASYDEIALQRRLGREFKQSITYIMLYGAAMTLETLQALLVHLAWYVSILSTTFMTGIGQAELQTQGPVSLASSALLPVPTTSRQHSDRPSPGPQLGYSTMENTSRCT